MGRVAVIGWGSLIWDLDDLAPHVDGAWRMRSGPQLKMEFTRVSPKRKMGLAVCIDPDHGQECQTHVIESSRTDCTEAVRDLAARERTEIGNIGALCRRTGIRKGSDTRVVAEIEAWCRQGGWQCAVWTDIGPNFETATGAPFTVLRAVAYLKGLEGESLDEAVRYIEKAPVETDTPLRRALAADPWWQDHAARLRT
ncbi:MAG: hypothetical protein AAF415_15600 [Pseudomonadota bacterium]